MSRLQPQCAVKADVAKKGVLKYKASKVKGTTGASALGPKSSKSLFMVFRALHSGEKFLHLYVNEKKFHEADDPKWDVSLEQATNIKFMFDRKCFCISMSDGGLIFLDSSTLEDAEEWVRCLNAVLFAKGLTGDGTLRYDVDMVPNSMLCHHGASILELINCDLVIWDSEGMEEIVHWKLNHLRSFKARKQRLTIVAGSRSCTGFGEFVFKAQHSVQITHAIETIVAQVKLKCIPIPSQNISQEQSNHYKSRPHQSEPPIPSNIPDVRDPMQFPSEGCANSSIIANIPNFTPSELYDTPDEPDLPPLGYELLDHNTSRRLPPPSILGVGMTSTATNYEQLDRQKKMSSRGNSPISSPHEPNYDLPDMPDSMSQRPHSKSPRLDARAKSGYEDVNYLMPAEAGKKCDSLFTNRRMSAPQDCTNSAVRPSAAKSPLPAKKLYRTHPNLDHAQSLLTAEDSVYSAISEDTQKQAPPHKALLPPKPLRPQSEYSNLNDAQKDCLYEAISEETENQVSGHKGHVPAQPAHMLPSENYGKLDHTKPSPTDDLYDAISEESHLQVVHPEMYNKLSHINTQLPSLQAEDYGAYGELDHGREAWEGSKGGASAKSNEKDTVASSCRKKISEGVDNALPDNLTKVEGYEMLQGKGKSKTRHTVLGHPSTKKWIPQPESEEYGRLKHKSTKTGKKSNRPKPKQSSKSSSALSHKEGVHSNFDPYGTLPSSSKSAGDSSSKSAGDSSSKSAGDSSIDSQSINDKPGDMIEEECSTPIYNVVDKPKVAQRSLSTSNSDIAIAAFPPPGYEKFTPLCPSTAQLASRLPVLATELNPPSAPPRKTSIKKKRYENVSASGEVLIKESPISEEKLNLGTGTENDTYNQAMLKVAALLSPVSLEGASSKVLQPPITESKPMLAPKPKVKPRPKVA